MVGQLATIYSGARMMFVGPIGPIGLPWADGVIWELLAIAAIWFFLFELNCFRTHPARRLALRAPGSIVVKITSFVYSKRKYERVFAPTVSDMREEYYEALAMGRTWQSRWVWARGTCSVLAAVLADVPLSLFGLFRKIWTVVQ
jgi:hypothetical protein